MRWIGRSAGICALACTGAMAQAADALFAPAQVEKGADIYAQNCSPCHGARMADPNAAFDLRTFPSSEKTRFVISVTKGKRDMPPWGDLFTPEDIEALWAYVIAGEQR